MENSHGDRGSENHAEGKHNERPTHKVPASVGVGSALLVIATFFQIVTGAHGIWREWYILPLLILLILVAGVRLHQWLGEITVWHKSTILFCSLIFTCETIGIVCLAYAVTWPIEGWLPPELPEGCPKCVVHYGGTMVDIDVSLLRRGLKASPVGEGDFDPVVCYLRNNRFFVDAIISGGPGTAVISIRGAEIVKNKGLLPPEWDVNSTSNALEIVDANRVPIFQIYYAKPEVVFLRGLFPFTNVAQILVLNDTNFIIEAIPNFNFTQYHVKPIFKYPSWNHMGQYVEE